MQFKNKKLFFSLALFFLILFPFMANAQGIVPCGHGDNPANACTLCHLIIGVKNLIGFGLGILITVAAVGIFIAGVMYILSSGNEQSITTAKNFLGASIKGFAIVLMAWFFVNITMWIISAKDDLGIKATNWYTFSCSTKSSIIPPKGGASGSW